MINKAFVQDEVKKTQIIKKIMKTKYIKNIIIINKLFL